MVYSLSEIEAHAKKAARGAGFQWGYAEEAGKAARLLAAYQLPGMVVLADYLSKYDAQSAYYQPPQSATGQPGHWVAHQNQHRTQENTGTENHLLCPLLSAACLADQGATVFSTDTDTLQIQRVASPLLMLPIAVLLSRRKRQQGIQLNWAGAEIRCYQGLVNCVTTTPDALTIDHADPLDIKPIAAAKATGGVAAGNIGQAISDAVWLQLDEFAKRTYVPNTEASRRGAGPAD